MLGILGCMCDEGDVCGDGSDGEQLVCDTGVCVSADCPTGESGCVCDS